MHELEFWERFWLVCYDGGMSVPRKLGRVWRSLDRRDWAMLLSGAVLVLIVFGIAWLIYNAQTPLRPEADTITSPWIPATVKHWRGPIDDMAKKYKVDPNFVAIIMTMESGGDPKAHSSANAEGLMQITPPTAKDIAGKYLKQPVQKYNLKDPRTNIEFGTAYLAKLRDIFGAPGQGPTWNETVELVAAGYNGGPLASNHLEKGLGLHDTQTVIYSRDAFNMWRERHSKNSPTFDRWKERGGQELLDAAKKNQ
jgi:soluble lytic murein transglycosylase-like protein